MIQDRLVTIGRIVTAAAALLGIIWAAVFGYALFAYLHSPSHPVRVSGNTIPWSNHGFIHYVTPFEKSIFDHLWGTAWLIIVVGFVGLALYRGWNMFNRR
jgi:cobalamin biosynthesis protein CobD/CbiB